MTNKTLSSINEQDIQRFDRWAASYERSVFQKVFFGPIHTQMLGFFQREGPKETPGTILDVGCGTGRLLRAASVRWPEAHLLGVDPAEHMITEAARLNPKATFQLSPAEVLPFPDHSADLVFSSISFHHWKDQQTGIQEIARVLRPGGWFCLGDHVFLLSRLLGENVRSGEEVRRYMKNANLTVCKQKLLGVLFVLITLSQKPAINQ